MPPLANGRFEKGVEGNGLGGVGVVGCQLLLPGGDHDATWLSSPAAAADVGDGKHF